jgi:hypothetical protein
LETPRNKTGVVGAWFIGHRGLQYTSKLMKDDPYDVGEVEYTSYLNFKYLPHFFEENF